MKASVVRCAHKEEIPVFELAARVPRLTRGFVAPQRNPAMDVTGHQRELSAMDVDLRFGRNSGDLSKDSPTSQAHALLLKPFISGSNNISLILFRPSHNMDPNQRLKF